MKVYGEIKDGYDITEHTNIGKLLYKVASLPEVTSFLETGTQIGGSARIIASALSDTGGFLHTVEAIKSRVEQAQENLYGLPVKVHWMVSKGVDDLKSYYGRFSEEIAQNPEEFITLVKSSWWKAVFLDSCSVSQMYELKTIIEHAEPKHILMHEPDHKCPNYHEYMSYRGYQLVESGTDQIGGHNPLYVYYQKD